MYCTLSALESKRNEMSIEENKMVFFENFRAAVNCCIATCNNSIYSIIATYVPIEKKKILCYCHVMSYVMSIYSGIMH